MTEDPTATTAGGTSTSDSTSWSGTAATAGTDTESTGDATSTESTTSPECTGSPEDMSECDLWCQDCPEAGDKCVALLNQGTIVCRPEPGDPSQPGEPCTVTGELGEDDCAKGSTCLGLPPLPPNVCIDYCKGTPDAPYCPDETTRCMMQGDVPICMPICDPLLHQCPKTCAALDQTCPDCFPLGPRAAFICQYLSEAFPEGWLCQDQLDCQVNLFCAPTGRVPECGVDERCCARLCDLEAPDCPPGTICVPTFEAGAAPAIIDHVGVCLTP